MRVHVKRRARPAPGSISAALHSFRAEVWFYREIAPVIGVRVPACYQAEDTGEGSVLVPSLLNMRTSPDGQVALLDWEDVSAAPGVLDLAWLLVSSVEPAQWDQVIAAYGPAAGLIQVLPAVAVQGLLSLSDTPRRLCGGNRMDSAPGGGRWLSEHPLTN